MNILIINQPPFNRGDESAHKGLIRALLSRMPDANIKVMYRSYEIESIRQYRVVDTRVEYLIEPSPVLFFTKFQNQGLRHGRTWMWSFHPTFIKYRKIFKWADWVISAPGGICMGGFQDWLHLFNLKLTKFFGCRLAYYGRSFGPFPTETESNRKFKAISLEMLHYFSFLSIRDKKTELLADELGLTYTPTVDSAFLDDTAVPIPYELNHVIGERPYMVFVPNYLLWHYAYKGRVSHETIIKFYCRLMDEIWMANPELNIVMLPQLFCGREYSLNDVELFRDLGDMKKDSRLIVVADCYSSDVQQSIIRGAKYVIGARYHSIVFAINQGVPCIALSYEHKIAGLLDSLGKFDWYVDFVNVLDNEENQAKCLHEIREKILLMTDAEKVRAEAKEIAGSCMNKFIKILKNE
ncbi:MAG: polysaccharide pyruvyl transferase family protein [Paludibacteraceae bacterium]|nr:polysaccharide pyruvyl transferase family protein [Paludibacteraceae bacterium]MBO5988903.1 polysaccharide pyruvyl transferase family protein [Paludibacteraceae bacterium]